MVPTAETFPSKADVVIIGGGIIGVATAFYASRAGLATVLVEKRDQLGSLATAVSSECVREQWNQPHNAAMMRESLSIFEHFADEVGIPGYDIGLHQQGYLFLTTERERARAYEGLVRRQHAWGLTTVELLTGDEARRRFPFLAPIVVAGRFNPRDGWLAAHEVLQGYVKGSTALFLLQTAVTSIDVTPRGVAGVVTTRGRIACPLVVDAAGPFAGQVAALAGVELPLVNERRQEVRLGHYDDIPAWAPMTIDHDTGVYWRPDGPGALAGGGDREPPGPPLERVPTDWDFPAVVLDRAARLTPFWATVAEKLRGDELWVHAGQYSYVSDRCPVIGPTPVAGFFLNCAYDGHGIMGAPAGARLLVDLIMGRRLPSDNPFSYQRLLAGKPLAVEEAIL
jgi:sarcosine oxidase subunit beta